MAYEKGSPVDGLISKYPKEWIKILDENKLSEKDIYENPEAMVRAIKFYLKYDIKKEKYIWPLFQTDEDEGSSCDQPELFSDDDDVTDNAPFRKDMSEREFIVKMAPLVSKIDDPNTKYNLGQLIGKGGTAEVYSAYDNVHGLIVAVKEMCLEKMQRKDLVYEEIAIMTKLKHKNIVNYLECFILERKRRLWIVMEYLDGGSLRLVAYYTKLLEDQMSSIMRQCLLALAFLHQMNIIHRDVKSDNVLLGMNGQVKLTDFGFCARLRNECELRSSVVGTLYWMAPEVAREESYDSKIDIWSLGIMLVEMIDGLPPYYGESQFRTILKIASNHKPPVKEASRLSSEANGFIDRCLQPIPSLRSSAIDLLTHPFITRYVNTSFDISENITVSRKRYQQECNK